jgi:S-adenosylmethionine hydrolase
MSWKPSGIVTLLTDFGVEDSYVGQMHGVLHATAAQQRLTVTDLTHAIPPQNVVLGAFQWQHAWSWFPAGTVHVAVVDPGVGTKRRILVARKDGHAFLAPDNGLMAPLLDERDDVRALDIDRFALPRRSSTFHGRDVFAPTAARIATGLDPSETGAAVRDWVRLEQPPWRRAGEREIRGEILCVDRFGNLVTNVPGDALGAEPAAWSAHAGALSMPVVRTYGEVEAGGACALVDSFGCVELAVRGGSASDRLGLLPGATVIFTRRN